jgi:hypothetical protein
MADTSSSVAAPRCTNLITELNDNDVLLGRGTGSNDFTGNQRYRGLVAEYKERYNTAPKNEDKNRIARELFEEVLRLGGRFLKLVETETPVKNVVDNGVWYEVEESKALEKCKQALRDGWVRENRGSSKRTNEGINIGEDISRALNVAGSYGVGIGVAVDPAFLTRGFVHGLSPSLPSHLVPILPSTMHENTGSFVGDVHPLIFQATPFALQKQIAMAQLMESNIFNPSSINRSVQNWNDANVLPSVHAPVGNMVQGLFHDMYHSVNTSVPAASLYGSSLANNNALISRPRDLTLWQTDVVATAPGSATSSKSGDDRSPGTIAGSKCKDNGHTVAANEAAQSAYQSSLKDNAIQGLLQLQTDFIEYQAGRNSSHAVMHVDGRNDGIYSIARSSESSPSPSEYVSAQALLSSLEARPMFTEEQLMIELVTMTNEERAETLRICLESSVWSI